MGCGLLDQLNHSQESHSQESHSQESLKKIFTLYLKTHAGFLNPQNIIVKNQVFSLSKMPAFFLGDLQN